MDQEKRKKGSSALLWIVVAIVVVLIALSAWYFTKGKDGSASTTSSKQAAVTAPAGWQKFTSSKYGYTLYYPAEYRAVEETSNALKLFKGDTPIMDMYSTAVTEAESDIKASVALYTDASKGYMTGGTEAPMNIAGQSGKKASGTFGKNAGAQIQIHDGIKGSYAVFAKGDRLWNIHSFDNGDATAQKNFSEILETLSF